ALHSTQLRALEPFLTDDLVQRYLCDLECNGLIQRNEKGAWLLSRDLQTLTLYDFYATSGYRLPMGEPLPGDEKIDTRGEQALAAADGELRKSLDIALSEIFPPLPRSE